MAAAGPAAQPPESLRPCCLGTVQRASSRPHTRCWASICAACVFCDRRRRGGALSHTRPSCAHAPLAPQCAIDLRWLARNSAPLSPTVCVRVQLAGPKSSIATVDFFFLNALIAQAGRYRRLCRLSSGRRASGGRSRSGRHRHPSRMHSSGRRQRAPGG